jgi:hypothetical protein
MSLTDQWKIVILSRYCGEFVPASEEDATVRKTSEDICMDLSGMGTFSAEEISAFLTQRGYTIGFEDSEPVWLMKQSNMEKSLTI